MVHINQGLHYGLVRVILSSWEHDLSVYIIDIHMHMVVAKHVPRHRCSHVFFYVWLLCIVGVKDCRSIYEGWP